MQTQMQARNTNQPSRVMTKRREKGWCDREAQRVNNKAEISPDERILGKGKKDTLPDSNTPMGRQSVCRTQKHYQCVMDRDTPTLSMGAVR